MYASTETILILIELWETVEKLRLLNCIWNERPNALLLVQME